MWWVCGNVAIGLVVVSRPWIEYSGCGCDGMMSCDGYNFEEGDMIEGFIHDLWTLWWALLAALSFVLHSA